MKEAIVSLIVVGGMLVATPAIFETVKVTQATRIMSERSDLNNLRLNFELATFYQFGCWITGSLMAATGIHLTYKMLRTNTTRSTYDSAGGE